MADRSLWVRIKADASGLVSGLSTAGEAVRNFDSELAQNAEKRAALDEIGDAYRNIAISASAALAVVVKSAMDWETAWAGVQKTVNGTSKEMSMLEDELRELARTMPVTHEEIAATAEAAGQLGVQREGITAFTKTMLQLGETTNLTSEVAATSLAQIMNVMQTAPEDVDNLGAALVALGNDGASTEADILAMAQNIAGAGATIGLTETDVFGLANALASVGIEAEAGGSAVSKILIDMAKAAKTGSPALAKFAETSGVSVDRFKELMDKSPARAFDKFTKGLGRIKNEGGDVFTLLKQLGQSDVRVTRALLGMANSGDLLTDSLDLGASSFKENTALTSEYAKRAETAAAKVQVAWNGIKDNLIDIGQDALPVVVSLSESVTDLTTAFGGLPKPVQGGVLKFIAMTAALAGTMAIVTKVRAGMASMTAAVVASGAATATTAKRYMAMRGGAALAGLALLSFADAASKSDKGLGGMMTTLGAAALGFAVAGPWGAAVGGAVGLVKSFADANRNAIPDIDALTESLDKQTGALTANSVEMVKKALQEDGTYKAGKSVGLSAGTITDAAVGDAAAQAKVNETLRDYVAVRQDALDAASTALGNVDGTDENAVNAAKTAVEKAAEALDKARGAASQVNDSLGAQDGAIADAVDQWENLTEAQRESAEANRLNAGQMTAVNKAVKGLPPQVATQLTTPGYEGALNNILDLQHRYKLTPAQVKTMMQTLDYASDDIKAVLAAMKAVDGTTAAPKINVNAGSSYQVIDGIARSINNLTGKTVYVKVAQKGGTPGGIVKDSANGNIFDYYADGGVRENHIAQIAPAGSWRVWAEPETGGEAYIPLAQSKRKRSLDLWMETGRRLDAFADGGVVGGRAGGPISASLVGAQARLVGPDLVEFVSGQIVAHMDGREAHQASRARARR